VRADEHEILCTEYKILDICLGSMLRKEIIKRRRTKLWKCGGEKEEGITGENGLFH
jgi:hypothetical protein